MGAPDSKEPPAAVAVVVLGAVARRVIGEVVDLETGKGEVRGRVLELGSLAVAAGEESWDAAGDGVAALGQA